MLQKNRYTDLPRDNPDNSMEITLEVAETPHKTRPSIFIKSQIQNYHAFCENIKKNIEPRTVFSCKSTINSLKLNVWRIINIFLISNLSNLWKTLHNRIIRYLKGKHVNFYTS